MMPWQLPFPIISMFDVYNTDIRMFDFYIYLYIQTYVYIYTDMLQYYSRTIALTCIHKYIHNTLIYTNTYTQAHARWKKSYFYSQSVIVTVIIVGSAVYCL